ncbi:MAG: dihydroorotate dehydrogenase [Vampirovibrionales bacterium]|nr:dihydroorotate dehydrogenase [Vampirovibrionales bacterium]
MTPTLTNNPLATTIGDLALSSPLLNASGCFNAPLFDQLTPLRHCMGGIVTKTVTPQPRPGNWQGRTCELPGLGMLNSIGLQNPGLEVTLATDLPALAALGLPIILSLSAETPEAFGLMVETIEACPLATTAVAGYELNVSCPNVAQGGVDFGTNPALITAITQAVRNTTQKALWVKLTPNVASVLPMVEASMAGGASGVTAINTVLGAHIDIKTKKPMLSRTFGGYSGPGIRPIALYHVMQIHKAFPTVPIVAVGGIRTTEDVLMFLMAGASAVQVGTMAFPEPTVFERLAADLHVYCQSEGIHSLSEVRGIATQ